MNHRGLILIILFALAIKAWVYTPFIIPSSSMDNTLIKGDYLIVNKWQNSIFGEHLNLKSTDIVAFHYPLEKVAVEDKMVYIKRCIGMPGDTVLIKNGETKPNESNLQFDYLISDPENVINWDLLTSLGIHLGGRTTNNNWLLSLGEQQIDVLKKEYPSLSFNKYLQAKNNFDLSVFPSDTSLKWNQDFYGPLYVPKKGDQIKINMSNISLYTKIIEVYENHSIKINQDSILIDGKLTEEYTFKQDYYFMMGDNRHHSKDSRHWGFVPHDHLIGTCATILFNIEDFSFNRLLKPIK
jgi:signal peptidase I